MNAIFLLIPLTLLILLLAVLLFIWAVNNEQFEDLERHGQDILFEDDKVNND